MDNTGWWISQKMFSYQNPDTSVMLTIMLESGIFEDNDTHRSTYHPPRVALQIYDGRVQGSRVQVELQFAEMNKLVESIDTLFSKGKETVFRTQSTVSVTRYWKKAHKTVTILYRVKNNKAGVEIKLTDPTSIGERVIFLDYAAYTGMYNFIKQVRDSYALIASNILTVAMQERMVERMSVLSNNMNKLRTEIRIPRVVTNDIQTDVEMKSEVITESVTNQFESSIDIDKIKLDEPKSVSTKPKKELDKFPMPFIGNFMGYDPSRLCNWVSAYLCADDKSDENTFCVLSSIPAGCNVNYPKVSYDYDYYLNVVFRKGVKQFLEKNEFIKFKVPIIDEFSKIDDARFKQMCVEIAFTGMVFMIMSSSYLKKIKDGSLQTNSEFMKIRITNYFLNYVLMPFIKSVTNTSNLKEEILNVANKCRCNGFLDKLNEMYEKLVSGGKFDLSDAVILPRIEGYVKALGNVKTINLGEIILVSDEYKITPFEGIKSEDEVKTCVLGSLNIQNDSKKKDTKLELFIESISKIADSVVIEKLKATCNKYSELEIFLRGSNVSEEILRIKRVMDADKSLNRRSDVLKAAKGLLEDPSVTETRVMFEEDVKENADGIRMDENLENILFGADVGI